MSDSSAMSDAMSNIEGKESPEMYLKTIYLINQEKNYCRHVDVANWLGVSKSSVSVAVNKLKKDGFLQINEDGMIILTAAGQKRARLVYDKFCFCMDILKKAGIDTDTAKSEACKFEHCLSDNAFSQIKLTLQSDR